MGWFGGFFGDKESVVQACLKPWRNEERRVSCKVIEHSLSGSTLWSVREITHEDTGETERFIELDLIKYRSGEYMYKQLEETCGPVETNCPLKFLDMVEDPGSYATEWRQRVREYHSMQNERRKMLKRIVPGCTLRLRHTCTVHYVLVTSVTPFIYGRDVISGTQYRIPKKHIEEVILDYPLKPLGHDVTLPETLMKNKDGATVLTRYWYNGVPVYEVHPRRSGFTCNSGPKALDYLADVIVSMRRIAA